MQNGNDYIIERNIYMEDMDREYARIAGYHGSHKNIHKQTQEDADADSLRRHEMERGSDVDYLKQDGDKISVARNISQHNVRIDETMNDMRDPTSVVDGRDQLFIKEGNTEILRLVTRGGQEEERYVNIPRNQQMRQTVVPNQYVVVDNGKDILMQRYIEDQGDEVKNMRAKLGRQNTTFISNEKGYVEEARLLQAGNEQIHINHIHPSQMDNNYQNLDMPIPGSVLQADLEAFNQRRNSNSLHMRQEILETSLRQQNELLRQILMQKEKSHHYQDASSQFENKLETQSLPGHTGHSVMATQTECHSSTQTEPLNLRPARRKARSDIDESFSEEEYEMYIGDSPRKIKWVKRKKPKKRRGKYKEDHPKRSVRVEEVKRKIRTPIMEEAEISVDLENDRHSKKSSSRDEYHKVYGDNKTRRILIHEISADHSSIDNERPVRSALKKDILIEISNSLDDSLEGKIRPRLVRQRASTKYEDSDGSASDENNHKYRGRRRNSDEFTDDSLEMKSTNEKETSSRKSTGKDKRNSVFSRQGSSTDAKDGISIKDDTKSGKHVFSSNSKSSVDKPASGKSDVDEKNIRNISASESMEVQTDEPRKHSEKEKTNDGELKKSSEKQIDVSKSVPRYMQWYSKNGPPPTQPEKKVVPAKPKRLINRSKVLKETPEPIDKKVAGEDALKKKPPSKQVTSEKLVKTQHDHKKTKPEEKKERDNVKLHSRPMKGDKVKPAPEGPLPDAHPRLQHSEHRYERDYQNQNANDHPTHLPPYLQPPVHSTQQTVSNQPLYVNQIPVNTQPPSQTVTSHTGQPTTVYLNSSEERHDIDDRLQSTKVESPHSNLAIDTSTKESNVSVKHFKGVEDDDSGIAMTSLLAGQTNSQNVKRLPITEKQSIFTIAYNDVHTKQLRPDSSTPSI